MQYEKVKEKIEELIDLAIETMPLERATDDKEISFVCDKCKDVRGNYHYFLGNHSLVEAENYYKNHPFCSNCGGNIIRLEEEIKQSRYNALSEIIFDAIDKRMDDLTK